MRRIAVITVGVIGLALVIFVGKQYSHYQTPLSKDAVRIGTIPDFPTACRVAFPLLVAKLRSDPSASTVAVDWHPQTFARYLFSLDPPDSGFCELYYDRASRRFAAFE